MMRLFVLMKKNFKLLARTRSSALIVVFGPLLLMLLVGAAFNTANIYGIRVGVFSEEYSPLTEALLEELRDEEYAISKARSETDCVGGVESAAYHVCAVFPQGLSVKDGGMVTFYVDNSRTNIVSLITSTISREMSEKSKELSSQLTKTVVDTLGEAEIEVEDKKVLMKKVLEDQESVIEGLAKARDELLRLNLEFKASDLPLSTLKDAVDEETNPSGAAAAVEVERAVKSVESDVSIASQVRKKVADGLAEISLVVSSDESYLSAIASSFTQISSGASEVKLRGIEEIVNPLTTEIKPITTGKTHLNFIFPTLLVMIMMFVALLLASTLEIREKMAKVYFKNFITPTGDLSYVFGNYLTNLIIILVQSAILLSMLYVFFKEDLVSMLPHLIPLVLLVASVFLFLGMIIGNIFKSEETGLIAAVSIGFIFLFFSSAILPVEALSPVLREVTKYNPFFLSEMLVNKVMLFKASLLTVLPAVYILVAYAFGLMVITIVLKKMTKRQE